MFTLKVLVYTVKLLEIIYKGKGRRLLEPKNAAITTQCLATLGFPPKINATIKVFILLLKLSNL